MSQAGTRKVPPYFAISPNLCVYSKSLLVERAGKIHRARCALASCGLSLSTWKECWLFGCGIPLGMRTPGGSTCGGGQSRSSSGGVLLQICSAIWRILPASCFRPYTHPSRGCHPSAPLGPSCKAKCRLGGRSCGRWAGPCPRQRSGHSQAQLSHQPSQPSSLHCLWGRQLAQAPAYPLLRCPTALTLRRTCHQGTLDNKSGSRGTCVSYECRGAVEAC